jgi:hypothetical protein
LYDVKQKAQLELCAPLAIRFPIANYCTRWHFGFEGLAQYGGRVKFSENIRATPFNNNYQIIPLSALLDSTLKYFRQTKKIPGTLPATKIIYTSLVKSDKSLL